MNHYLFKLIAGETLDDAREDLIEKGLQNIFVIEDDSTGEILIGGCSEKTIKTDQAILTEQKKAEVDWDEQWSLFAENYAEGKAHIDLCGKTLLLYPGAGFGDLSHPTTYLMLEMMKKEVPGKSVVDIGTGSGILALGSLLMGAESACGIDIDPEALKHARKNAKLNRLKARFSTRLPKKLPSSNLFLMNMIFPEQQQVSPQTLNPIANLWITSGILKSQRESYLRQTTEWRWKLLFEQEKEEWCGFIMLPPGPFS